MGKTRRSHAVSNWSGELDGRDRRRRSGRSAASPRRRTLILESLEARTPLAVDLAARFEFTDLAGTPLSTVQLGADFELRMYVRDNRGSPGGIKQTYFDVSYPSSLVSVNGAIDHGVSFTSAPAGDASVVGLLDEVGGRDPDLPPVPASAEELLFRVPFRANSVGTVNVTAALATRLTFFFETVVGLQPSNVGYSGGTIDIIGSGITVAPTSGLVTSESGGTATFAIVLQAQPTADVTIALSSSDPSEGTVSPSSVTFTSANWNSPRVVTVSGVDDAVVDGPQGFSIVTGPAVSGDTRYSGVNAADVSVTNLDNDTATLSLSAPVITESNADQTVNFTVTLDKAVAGGLNVALASVDGTATAGSDYVINTGSPLSFDGAAGETKNISVTIKGEQVVEVDETFTLTLGTVTSVSPVPAGSIVTGASKVGTIVNDDISLSIAPADAIKSEGSAGVTAFTYTITRTGLTTGATTVNYTVAGSGLNAANAADFGGGVFPSGVVTFAPGQTTQSLTINVSGDASVEFDEGFIVTLGGASGGAQIAADTALGTILNDDVSLAIAAADASKPEGNSGTTSFTFTVTRAGLTTGTTTVNYSLAASGANPVSTADFVGGVFPGGVVMFGNGESSKLVTIPVSGDTAVETDEGFVVTLSGASGGAQIVAGAAPGTILNDDGSLAIVATDTNKPEGNSGTTPLTFTVTRSGLTTETTTVNYAVTGTGANPASQFDFVGGVFPSGVVTFNPGENSKTLPIPVSGDASVEFDEGLTITLSGASGGAQISTGSATGTIQNDDTATLTLTGPAITESNADQTVNFTVTLDKAVAGGFTVAFITANGTATAADYLAPTTSPLTFVGVAGETRTIAVTITGDQVVEGNETFSITLGAVIAPAAPQDRITTGASITATIVNDDNTTLSIGNLTQVEGSSGGATVFRFDVASTNAVAGGFDLPFNVAGVTAAVGADYNLVTTSPLRFAGTTAGEIQTIIVSVNADTTVESNETFSASLGTAINLSGGISPTRIGVPSSPAIGTITNDDAATLTINNVSKGEGSGGGTTLYVFDVVLSNGVAGGFDVAFNVAGGTATLGGDFSVSTNSPLRFAGAANETLPITVLVNADTFVETDESFQVTLGALGNLGSGIAAGTISTVGSPALGTIVNDDTATISIGDVTHPEGDAGLTVFEFTITLSQSVDVPVQLSYATADGTATASTGDYQAASGTVDFQPGGPLSKTITVSVVGDVVAEPTETFKVMLSNLVAGAPIRAVTLNRSEAIGTIQADDGALLSIADAQIAEGDAGVKQLTFNVTLSKAISVPVTIDYATADGSARTADGDYAAAQGTLTFSPQGPLTQQITVSLNGDAKVERDETFQVALSNLSPSSSEVIVSRGTASGTIANDDDATLNIASVPGVEGDSGAKSFEFQVTLSEPVDVAVTIRYATADGTAQAADGDYQPASGTLVFNPSDPLTKTLSVAVSGDTRVEPDEQFTLVLSDVDAGNPPRAVTLGTASGVGTITNDDVATLAISASRPAAEEATNGEFTITSNRRFQSPVTINLTVGGTALAGADYTALGSTIVFPANTDSITLPVSVLGDKLVEGNESVLVTMTGTNSIQASVGAQNAATVNIADNDTATLAIAATTSLAEQNGAQAVVVTLTTSDGAGGTATLAPGVSLSAEVVDAGGGTAARGADYAVIDAKTVTFAAGATNGASEIVSVIVLNDTLIEGNETVLLRLRNLSSVLNGQASLGNVNSSATITDNDTATLAIEPTGTMTEQAGGQGIVVTLTTSDGAGGTATVAPGVSLTADVVDAGGGTATSGADYAVVGAKTVSFAAGAGSGATANLILDVINDSLVEGSETVRLRVQNINSTISNQVSVGNANSVVTITDNDTASVSIVAVAAAPEAGGAATIAVTLTTSDGAGGAATLATGVAVTADVVDAGGGTAASGLDYSAVGAKSVTFAAGSGNGATANVTLNILNDTLVEGAEAVNLRLQNVQPAFAGLVTGAVDSVVTIQDNDTALLSIETTKRIFETSGPQSILVTLATTDGAGGPATLAPGVSLSAQVIDAGGGTATSGVDYQAFGTQTVTFGVNDGNNATRSVSLTPIPHAGVDPSRTVNLRLQSLSNTLGGQASLGNTNSVVTVADAPPISELHGFVYADVNGNGLRDAAVEFGVPGVIVTLTGTDVAGRSVQLAAMTADDGAYGFTGLSAGTYQLTETHAAAFLDGQESSDVIGATITNDSIANIRLDVGAILNNNNFGELGLRAQFITARMFTSSTLPNATQLRAIVARAEELAGRASLAQNIRIAGLPSIIHRTDTGDGEGEAPIAVLSAAPRAAVASPTNSSSNAPTIASPAAPSLLNPSALTAPALTRVSRVSASNGTEAEGEATPQPAQLTTPTARVTPVRPLMPVKPTDAFGSAATASRLARLRPESNQLASPVVDEQPDGDFEFQLDSGLLNLLATARFARPSLESPSVPASLKRMSAKGDGTLDFDEIGGVPDDGFAERSATM